MQDAQTLRALIAGDGDQAVLREIAQRHATAQMAADAVAIG